VLGKGKFEKTKKTRVDMSDDLNADDMYAQLCDDVDAAGVAGVASFTVPLPPLPMPQFAANDTPEILRASAGLSQYVMQNSFASTTNQLYPDASSFANHFLPIGSFAQSHTAHQMSDAGAVQMSGESSEPDKKLDAIFVEGKVACVVCSGKSKLTSGARRGIQYSYICEICDTRWNQNIEPDPVNGSYDVNLRNRKIGDEPRRQAQAWPHMPLQEHRSVRCSQSLWYGCDRLVSSRFGAYACGRHWVGFGGGTRRGSNGCSCCSASSAG
jgi:hypothetical protein